MKRFVIILFIITFCKSDKIHKSDLDTFSDLKIRFITGDESIEFYSMHVIKKKNKIKAYKRSPFYYFGSQTDSIWEKNISSSDLKFIKEFIKTAKTFGDSCLFSSSSIDHYRIEIKNEKPIVIDGNCQWGNYDYNNLSKAIFKNDFVELEKKRRKVLDSIKKSVLGNWHITGWEHGVLENKEVVMLRTDDKKPNEGRFLWILRESPNKYFNEHGIKIYSKEKSHYQVTLSGKEVLLKIGGSTYKVLTVEKDIIKLKCLW
ncbi:hypothetical protein [Seonamhaeicola maritimus]|uniref:Uncharacterized protein n=1 Tax=Seonamhaeicola maritimus TaxID=2591822 RepID=A0A5C7GDM1_9FLAO|nr:hypothetical protein [Seonamhaeicola maritimus]TXG34548.1 hypothetical protein FUA22_18190 [Seonamhaeicola maritimus]